MNLSDLIYQAEQNGGGTVVLEGTNVCPLEIACPQILKDVERLNKQVSLIIKGKVTFLDTFRQVGNLHIVGDVGGNGARFQQGKTAEVVCLGDPGILIFNQLPNLIKDICIQDRTGVGIEMIEGYHTRLEGVGIEKGPRYSYEAPCVRVINSYLIRFRDCNFITWGEDPEKVAVHLLASPDYPGTYLGHINFENCTVFNGSLVLENWYKTPLHNVNIETTRESNSAPVIRLKGDKAIEFNIDNILQADTNNAVYVQNDNTSGQVSFRDNSRASTGNGSRVVQGNPVRSYEALSNFRIDCQAPNFFNYVVRDGQADSYTPTLDAMPSDSPWLSLRREVSSPEGQLGAHVGQPDLWGGTSAVLVDAYSQYQMYEDFDLQEGKTWILRAFVKFPTIPTRRFSAANFAFTGDANTVRGRDYFTQKTYIESRDLELGNPVRDSLAWHSLLMVVRAEKQPNLPSLGGSLEIGCNRKDKGTHPVIICAPTLYVIEPGQFTLEEVKNLAKHTLKPVL